MIEVLETAETFGLSDHVRLVDTGLPIEYGGKWSIEGICLVGGVKSYWLGRDHEHYGVQFHTCGRDGFERA